MFPSHPPPTILIAAIDLSDISPFVLRRAVDAAREMNATQLHFVHVYQNTDEARTGAIRCDRLGDWIGRQLRSAGALPPSVEVLAHESSGDPARVIVELADTLHASCIIVGAREADEDVGDTLLGSVAKAVVSGAACPVTIARPHSPYPRMSHSASPMLYG